MLDGTVGRSMLVISTVLPRDEDTDFRVAKCRNGSMRALNRLNVTLRIIWHRILRSIWHNGEPSEQRDSDLASFQDGALDPRPCTANQNARVLKTRHKAVISRSFQERFLRSVSSSSSGSACAREWTLEIGR